MECLCGFFLLYLYLKKNTERILLSTCKLVCRPLIQRLKLFFSIMKQHLTIVYITFIFSCYCFEAIGTDVEWINNNTIESISILMLFMWILSFAIRCDCFKILLTAGASIRIMVYELIIRLFVHFLWYFLTCLAWVIFLSHLIWYLLWFYSKCIRVITSKMSIPYP